MGERFYTTLGLVFGQPPVVFTVPQIASLAMLPATEFLASNDPKFLERVARPGLAAFAAANPPPFSPGAATIALRRMALYLPPRTFNPPSIFDDFGYFADHGVARDAQKIFR